MDWGLSIWTLHLMWLCSYKMLACMPLWVQRLLFCRPEFLNRVDDILVFRPLTKDSITKISELMLNTSCKRIMDSTKIKIKISDKFKVMKQFFASESNFNISACWQYQLKQIAAVTMLSGVFNLTCLPFHCVGYCSTCVKTDLQSQPTWSPCWPCQHYQSSVESQINAICVCAL